MVVFLLDHQTLFLTRTLTEQNFERKLAGFTSGAYLLVPSILDPPEAKKSSHQLVLISE